MALMTALAIGATVAGAALSAKSQKKAANTAAAAQTNAANQNAAVQREQLQAAQGALGGYVQRGNVAGGAINDLLGLNGTGQQSLPTAQPNALAQFQGAYPDSSGPMFGERGYAETRGGDPIYFGPNANADRSSLGTPAQATGQSAANPQQSAFDNFRNSTGYQLRLGEGMRAVNSGYAGAGTLQSGAALKAINEYGQNFASNEFGNYMGYLGNQQGVGLSGASALAGVGQNYANSISANNNNLAGALGNAALIKGNNNGFANALGTFGGTILGMGR